MLSPRRAMGNSVIPKHNLGENTQFYERQETSVYGLCSGSDAVADRLRRWG
jgi:hypothetical protein